MKKVLLLIITILNVIVCISCSKSNYSNDSGGASSISASAKYIDDIELVSYRNSGSTIYITQKAIINKAVSKVSNLEISVHATYQISVYFKSGGPYNTTLSSNVIIKGTSSATSQVYINSKYEVAEVEAIRASYTIRSVKGTMYLK